MSRIACSSTKGPPPGARVMVRRCATTPTPSDLRSDRPPAARGRSTPSWTRPRAGQGPAPSRWCPDAPTPHHASGATVRRPAPRTFTYALASMARSSSERLTSWRKRAWRRVAPPPRRAAAPRSRRSPAVGGDRALRLRATCHRHRRSLLVVTSVMTIAVPTCSKAAATPWRSRVPSLRVVAPKVTGSSPVGHPIPQRG